VRTKNLGCATGDLFAAHLLLVIRTFPGPMTILCENRKVQKYAVVIHEDPEGGYWGEVPALPGCYSQGESIDELMENIREAITGVLEVMKEQGQKPETNIQILDLAV
jgi:predicted RNase H-like HicB family nuclease